MMLFGAVLAAVFIPVGWMSLRMLRMRQVPLGAAVGVVAAALWASSVTVAWLVREQPHGRSELVRSLDSLAWPVATESAPVRAAVAQDATGVQAASVESLVDRLEARLAAQPNDANGWVLLAQSYAYTANEEAVERAVRRAVELGVDEPSLRERVANAKRSVHPVDWVDQALGTPR